MIGYVASGTTFSCGHSRLHLGRVRAARVDPVQAVDLGAVGHHEHRAIGVRERQMAALREQQVEVELLDSPSYSLMLAS